MYPHQKKLCLHREVCLQGCFCHRRARVRTEHQFPNPQLHISFFLSCRKKFRESVISFSMYRKQSKIIRHTKKQENITRTLEKI